MTGVSLADFALDICIGWGYLASQLCPPETPESAVSKKLRREGRRRRWKEGGGRLERHV